MERTLPARRTVEWLRLARLLVVGVCVGWGIAVIVTDLPLWSNQFDLVRAYLPAAERLTGAQQLYIAGANPDSADAYRYAPWFAAAVAPLLLLPVWLVKVLWGGAMLAASIGCMWRLRGSWAGYALMGLVGAYLLRAAAYGNVQPLLVLVLMLTVERRSGPVWIGLAASLKAVPLFLALVYLGRREWDRALVATAVAAIASAPMLLYDLSAYPMQPGPGIILLALLPAAIVGAILMAGSRWRWAAASVAVVVALPRFVIYDLSYLLIGPTSRTS